MMFVFSLLILLYLFAIGSLIYGFSKVPDFHFSGKTPVTRFTIVIPFRDEAQNLPELLKSLTHLAYPKTLFEVLFIDDDSEDGFIFPDLDFDFKVIRNHRSSNSPKKDAIRTAIQLQKNDWIITTDADCVVPPNWLLVFDNYIQEKNMEMIAGGVKYQTDNSFLNQFQALDLASLQGTTMGSFGLGQPFMCNGANFAYTKSIFEKLNGFDGNDEIASGDDVFLLQKAVLQFPEKVAYLKNQEAIVSTKALLTWKSLFFQRVRWASKASGYNSLFGKTLGILVFLTNLFWIFAFVSCVFETGNGLLFILISGMKFGIDWILISKTNAFLKTKTRYFFFGSLLYPVFSSFVALYSFFGTYQWKGRNFRK